MSYIPMKIYKCEHDYCVIEAGDAWWVPSDGEGYDYACPEKSLSNPDRWIPKPTRMALDSLPTEVMGTICRLVQTEYYLPLGH